MATCDGAETSVFLCVQGAVRGVLLEAVLAGQVPYVDAEESLRPLGRLTDVLAGSSDR